MFSEESTENKHTPECARLAAGSSLQAMKDVVTSLFISKAAFSLMRPPLSSWYRRIIKRVLIFQQCNYCCSFCNQELQS
ncbi:unnamed protein product [Moneuplotes crassus]|uniref:Uncharacterized protein n=1 Tax=Euplotes crassus TaxID=5936 RepID=A0AAD1UGI7_EUPCR|nr:unnamed protein product [Moneuplotes crassus]